MELGVTDLGFNVPTVIVIYIALYILAAVIIKLD